VDGEVFLIARNPEGDSRLPYLLNLPIEGGLVLKARDTWPRSARIYCHAFEQGWPEDAEVIEATPVSSCKRRGPVIDLVLARPRLARSQFVFTQTRGRPAIFWQNQKAARAANPGARIPRARALAEGFTILIDTRERYPYQFAGRDVKAERMALAAGDYAVANAEATIAVVERKTLENFTTSLSSGTLAFQMQDWARSRVRRLWSRGITPRCSASSTFPPRSSPMGLLASRCATPRSRLSSQTRGSSLRNGPIGSSRRRFRMPRAAIQLLSEGDWVVGPLHPRGFRRL
jgi:hypothetical protein